MNRNASVTLLLTAILAFAGFLVPTCCRAECIGPFIDENNSSTSTTLISDNATVTLNMSEGGIAEVNVETRARSNSDVKCQPQAADTAAFTPVFPLYDPSNGLIYFNGLINYVSGRIDAAHPYPFSLKFELFGPDKNANLEIQSICWDETGKVTITAKNSPDDHFYGLGEPRTPDQGLLTLDYQGKTRAVWNKHWAPADLPVNFFYNPRGYGFFVDNYSKGKFDFTNKDTFTYETDGGRIRFFVFAAKTPADAVSTYTKLTGRFPMPPIWTLGYMQSRYGYHDEKDFTGIMDGLRSRNIPADTIIFDLDWQGIGGMGNLEWTTESFPDPLAFTKKMEDRGFKTMVIVEPLIWTNTKRYMEARQKKLLARDEKGRPYTFNLWGRPGSLFDFCNPDTMKFWGETIKRLRLTGIDGWWTDLDEPDVELQDIYFYGKTPHNLCHNVIANLMSKSIADSMAANFPNERTFIFSRSGSAGISKYGTAVWSGDLTSSFQHLKNQIPVGINAGLSGMPVWGTDMGGFNGHPSAELFVRWFQFGLFNPIFRAHGHHDPREPWAYGPEAEKIMTDTINLRYRLLPHMYTVLSQMHETGLPPMRGLFMNFPDDKQSWNELGEYMFGDSILTAPVVDEGTTTKNVYFPPGRWYDFHTDKIHIGPSTITYPAPLDTLPLFIREGSVIPMAPAALALQYTGQYKFQSTELHVYPAAGKSEYTLYEDDGNTNEYKNGKFAKTKITVEPGNKGIKVTVAKPEGSFVGLPERRMWSVVIHGISGEVAAVKVDGEELKSPGTPALPDSATWSINKDNGSILVNLPMSPTGFTVEAILK